MNNMLFDFAKGAQLSIDGQRLVAAKNPEAAATIRREFLRHLKDIDPQPGSVDTLRLSGFQMPAMSNQNAIGASIGSLARKKLIECVGVVRGSRTSAHAGKMFTWRLTARGCDNV